MGKRRIFDYLPFETPVVDVEVAALPEARVPRAHRRLLSRMSAGGLCPASLGARRVEDAVDGVQRMQIVGRRMVDLVHGRGLQGWPDRDERCAGPVTRAARALTSWATRAAIVGWIGARGALGKARLRIAVHGARSLTRRGRHQAHEEHHEDGASFDDG